MHRECQTFVSIISAGAGRGIGGAEAVALGYSVALFLLSPFRAETGWWDSSTWLDWPFVKRGVGSFKMSPLDGRLGVRTRRARSTLGKSKSCRSAASMSARRSPRTSAFGGEGLGVS